MPSVLNVFQRQSMGLEYSAPRVLPVTGSVMVFSEVSVVLPCHRRLEASHWRSTHGCTCA